MDDFEGYRGDGMYTLDSFVYPPLSTGLYTFRFLQYFFKKVLQKKRIETLAKTE
jgi:hypothetical protein